MNVDYKTGVEALRAVLARNRDLEGKLEEMKARLAFFESARDRLVCSDCRALMTPRKEPPFSASLGKTLPKAYQPTLTAYGQRPMAPKGADIKLTPLTRRYEAATYDAASGGWLFPCGMAVSAGRLPCVVCECYHHSDGSSR